MAGREQMLNGMMMPQLGKKVEEVTIKSMPFFRASNEIKPPTYYQSNMSCLESNFQMKNPRLPEMAKVSTIINSNQPPSQPGKVPPPIPKVV